jgi:nucleoside-diphosphate kinase
MIHMPTTRTFSNQKGELTIGMIKPDGVSRGLVHQVQSVIRHSGLSIPISNPATLDRRAVLFLYGAQIAPKGWSPDVVTKMLGFFTCGPVELFLVEGDNAPARLLQLRARVRDSFMTERTPFPEFLPIRQNVLHASDPKDAFGEVDYFTRVRDFLRVE